MKQDLITEVTKKLTDEGKLIEAGFVGLKMMAFPADIPARQLDDFRNIFFAGAHHLFASILNILDPGAEITGDDLKRMSLIDNELKEFIKYYQLRHSQTKGNA